MDNTDRGSRLETWAGTGRDFTDVFREEFPRLAGYGAGLVSDREVGADLAQEGLARTWVRWSKVSSPRAYSCLVAINLARRYWKRLATETRTMPTLGPHQTLRRRICPKEPSDNDFMKRVSYLPLI